MGTTKTCMVVGEIHPDSTAAIIGVGEVPSAGIRKGEIADMSMARQCLFDAWQSAQDHADVEIMSVILSVTGEHIYGENGQGSYRLPDDEDIIEYEHTDLAREKAEKIEIAAKVGPEDVSKRELLWTSMNAEIVNIERIEKETGEKNDPRRK